MKQLTKRQIEIADFIEHYISENGFAPSVRNIADNFGFSSKAAFDHLKALKNKGVIKNAGNLPRSLSILKKNASDNDLAIIKVPFIDSETDTIPVTKGLLNITDSDSVYAMTVKSDSMKDIGILNGDTAVLLKTKDVLNGDIVSATIGDDDSCDLKYFFHSGNNYELRAANNEYRSKISSHCEVHGRLLLVIKRY